MHARDTSIFEEIYIHEKGDYFYISRLEGFLLTLEKKKIVDLAYNIFMEINSLLVTFSKIHFLFYIYIYAMQQ